ncbi:uncharacterized protein TRIADDRAFT_56070 [Trichoplax adhaerens]|uniref:G-protein coupled receptors family 1 profile domain-containing protein n=1 Tax=Trichoplax adhaerens TaxID=10228 RepID=B3RTW6_TRIAD|nr:hypothetical protein TRIADDRAFT_56070 [Trichoplax adhaerens]EDV25696.1 hypothetical protein TRIADDRAFT_56070 [Trichoplax adhaerens]|eukprot:XP_002111729.1 hypothetical protein TRIADDRAFT_56070 [Trichoplax adhaerens]
MNRSCNDDNLTAPISYAVTLGVAYGVIFVFAVIGNLSLAIGIIQNWSKMKTLMNVLVVNLAICDLGLAIIGMPFTAVHDIYLYNPLGAGFCFVWLIAMVAFWSANMITVTGIAIERFVKIIHPEKAKLQAKGGIILVIICWIISFGMAIPYALDIVNHYDNRQDRIICYNIQSNLIGRRAFIIFVFVFFFIVPVLVNIMLYSMIVYFIYSKANELRSRSENLRKRNSKVVTMLMMVVALFILCWFPFHLSQLLLKFEPQTLCPLSGRIFIAICNWLALSHCMVNPIIFASRSEIYGKVMAGVCKRGKNRIHISPSVLNTDTHSAAANKQTIRKYSLNDDRKNRIQPVKLRRSATVQKF